MRPQEPYNELFRAVEAGDADGVVRSIRSGIDVNTRDKRPLVGHGNSPLHSAADMGSLPIVRALLQLGADVNARCDSGWTPLLRACNAGHFAVARVLVEAGANVNLANDEGYPPVGRIRARDTQFLAWLRAQGANIAWERSTSGGLTDLDGPGQRGNAMADVMRISEQYFQRMLFETTPSEAVTALSNDWAPRARADEPLFGLARPEYYVTLCTIYTGEVGNGGHAQFFLNRLGKIARQTLEALDAVSFEAGAEILRHACSVFPHSRVPDREEEMEDALDALPLSKRSLLEDLDRALWHEPGDEVLLDYLRANADGILLPERGR